MRTTRRHFLGALAAGMAAAAPVRAQHAGHHGTAAMDAIPHHDSPYSHLFDPKIRDLPAAAAEVRFSTSSAPAAARQGRWVARASLPIPRSEMAWATVCRGRMHNVGGYGLQRVDRNYHHVYDPKADRWEQAAAIPFGANHIGVATMDDRYIYAIGGFIEQNRAPHSQCHVWDADSNQWRTIRPLPRPRGAIAVEVHAGRVHAIGGRDSRSVDWHEVYDPKADRWDNAAPLPAQRDHIGHIAHEGRIHCIGGRMDNFHFNTGLHHVYDPKADRWSERAPLPTPRSGHGVGLIGGRLHVVGGEGTRRVFGQNESYDFRADRWESHAPMTTPRHGLGAVAIGDTLYVAGGGPIVGGSIQSSIHEAFTLA